MKFRLGNKGAGIDILLYRDKKKERAREACWLVAAKIPLSPRFVRGSGVFSQQSVLKFVGLFAETFLRCMLREEGQDPMAKKTLLWYPLVTLRESEALVHTNQSLIRLSQDGQRPTARATK